MLDDSMLSLLVCPKSKQRLVYSAAAQELYCLASRLAYPIQDGMAVLLVERARSLTDTECSQLSAGFVDQTQKET